MSPRDTRTGGVLESMVLPSLSRGGYSFESQKNIGVRLGGKGRHIVDVLAHKEDENILISLKWQQTGGTAEQKVPFEVMSLAEALEDGYAARAYVVLGGNGWTLRDFYVSGGLNKFLKNCDRVKIMKLENFIAEANKGKL